MRFWHSTATLETERWVDLAVDAEAAGFDGVAVSDHISYTTDLQSAYPGSSDGKPFWGSITPWPDPWVLIGAMAASTKTLLFTTNVYVAPARDLFTVAKLVSTAAVVSGQRVSLGVGAGWCREEFEQTGQDFTTRGQRLDEMIEQLRRLWTGQPVAHQGRYYQFGELSLAPTPGRPVAILCGGDTPRALKRAAHLGDGWIGVTYTLSEAAEVVERLRGELKSVGREADPGFKVMLAYRGRVDLSVVDALSGLGVTDLVTAPWMNIQRANSPLRVPHHLVVSAIQRFGSEVIAPLTRANQTHLPSR